MSPLVLLLATGCIPELVAPVLPDNPDHDFDGDGVTENQGDCDDLRDAVSPNRAERCDGFDNDCDEQIDGVSAIDRATWFADADGDGFGSTVEAQKACEQPEGFVVDSSDCDDTDPAINPESVWYADADQDGFGDPLVSYTQCHPPNGFVANDLDCDDSDPDAVPAATWYADTDGDGLGDPAVSLSQCDAPAGYVANDLDCDDTDATAGDPDAAWYADVDGDGFGDASSSQTSCSAPANHVADDQDCDDTDADLNPLTVWYPDGDGDGYGTDTLALVQCEDPGQASVIDGDCDDSDSNANPGATEICGNGIDEDCSGDARYCLVDQLASDAASITLTSSVPGADLGLAVAGTSTHALLSAPGAATEAGSTYWLATPSTPGTIDVDAAAIVTLTGADPGDRAGESLALLGSTPEGAVVGAPDVGNAGAVYVWTDLTTAGSFTLSDSPAILDGEAQSQAGAAVVSIDLDDEGTPDIVVGAPGLQGGRGGVYASLAPYSGTRALADETDRLLGSAGSGAGTWFSAPADTTGDGSANDFLVAADGSAEVLLLTPPFTGTDLTTEAGTQFIGLTTVGAMLLHDIDGDGNTDAVFGDSGAGLVYLYLGPLASQGTVDLTLDADATHTGSDPSAGHALAVVADLDGDGLHELLVGAPTAGSSGSEGGEATLVPSSLLATDSSLGASGVIYHSDLAGDDLGWQVLQGPDIEDAPADLLVSAPGANAVYLIRGGPLD